MKKIVTILLAVVLIASMVISPSALYSLYTEEDAYEVYSEEAAAEYESETGQTPELYHYYFQMPDGTNGPVATQDVYFTETDNETGETHDVLVCSAGDHAPSWYNEFTSGAGIYWWSDAAEYKPDGWCGYRCEEVDATEHIYCAAVPAAAKTIIFNNGVDGGLDQSQAIYYKAAQSANITVDDIWEGDYTSFPEAADSHDGLIFIIDPDKVSVQPDNLKMTCRGTWYCYYGNGCYGLYAPTSDNYVEETRCVNPNHNHSASGDPEPGEELVRGDYDGDKEVTIMDASFVQKMVVELIAKPAAADLKKIDADGDEILTIIDATRIRNVVAAIVNIDGTPVEST